MRKEIRKYAEKERQMKVKLANLEKELEKERRETNYYRNGNRTPKTTKSFKSNYSGNSYKNSLYSSHYSHYSKNSKRSYSNTNASFLKKNLIPSRYKYKEYKPSLISRYSYYNNYGSKKRIGSNSISNKSRKTYGSGATTSSKGKYNLKKNYVSPYRYNKGSSPYRYAVDYKTKSNNSKNNTTKNSVNKKTINSRVNKENFNKKMKNNNYRMNDEVKKNNYIITRESSIKNNNRISNNKFNQKGGNHKKEINYKTINDRLSKIQNLINQANEK